MKPDGAAELMEAEETGARINQRTAITIAALARLLALTGRGGQNATKETPDANNRTENLFDLYQAKSQRQTCFAITTATFEGTTGITGVPPSLRTA